MRTKTGFENSIHRAVALSILLFTTCAPLTEARPPGKPVMTPGVCRRGEQPPTATATFVTVPGVHLGPILTLIVPAAPGKQFSGASIAPVNGVQFSSLQFEWRGLCNDFSGPVRFYVRADFLKPDSTVLHTHATCSNFAYVSDKHYPYQGFYLVSVTPSQFSDLVPQGSTLQLLSILASSSGMGHSTTQQIGRVWLNGVPVQRNLSGSVGCDVLAPEPDE